MKPLNKETANKPVRPERIIQFGEGNFQCSYRAAVGQGYD